MNKLRRLGGNQPGYRGHYFRGYGGVWLGIYLPWTVGAQIDVVQQGRSSPAFDSYASGINFTAPKLPYFHELLRFVHPLKHPLGT